MQHTFQVRTSELGTSFIKSIQSVFGNKQVKITVEDIANTKSTKSEVARFLKHREDHPAIKIEDRRDFNEISKDMNQ